MSEPVRIQASEVLAMARRALAEPAAEGTGLRARLAHARDLQRHFRAEPLGGKLLPLKRIFHWFTASAFDRQSKAVEALLDCLEEIVHELELHRAGSTDRTREKP